MNASLLVNASCWLEHTLSIQQANEKLYRVRTTVYQNRSLATLKCASEKDGWEREKERE